MPVKFEGTLKMFVRKSFTDKQGVLVEYFVAYFLGVTEDDRDEVLVANTKKDFSKSVDKTGVVHLELQNGKLSLKDFVL